ncbi:M20/M25/M40 family metallo-hydrolase [candidate division KSB1 bacterium]
MKKQFLFFLFVCLMLSPMVFGQSVSKKELIEDIRSYRMANEHKILKEFFDMLSIPNVSSDRQNIRRNAEHIKEMMEQRGIEVRQMETPGNPVVYGELEVPGVKQTLMFYLHYDGQPVNPSKWIDSKPFSPILRPGKMEAGTTKPKPILLPLPGEPLQDEWRIYARSSSDDKAPIIAILTAIDAIRSSGLELRNNLRFIFEGEEEAGSTNLRSFCEENRSLFETDVLFICDGPVYYNGNPTFFFGVRGITTMEITVHGANVGLHSGHFGNWAPNPGIRLAQLLATMKDKDGNVLINGFYDTVVPLSESEMKAIAAILPYDEVLKQQFGFSGVEGGGRSLIEMIQLPSLNIRGMQSGWVGEQARTIIPSTATASIDIRLVKGTKPEYMVNTVIEHIKRQGFHVVRNAPDDKTRMKYSLIAQVTKGGGYPAARTSMDLPISKRVVEALAGNRDEETVLLPTLGGSLPLYIFTDILDLPTIGLPIVNYDNNQHQPNENLRLGHLWKGIETFAAILMMEGE